MAKERIEIPVTPERTKPENVKLRKSTGKTSTSSSGEKVILPHYLRASTGSCHDFCKYGRKHAFEAEGKHRIWKGITATPADSDDSVNSATPVERKKKPVVKVRLSPDPKTQFLDKSKIIKREVSSPAKKIEVSAKEVVSFAKKSDVTAKPATSGKPKSATAKPSSSPLNLSGGLGAKRNSNVKMVKNSGTSKIGQKKALIPPIASVSPKPSVSRVSSLNTRKHTNQKVVSPLKNQTKVKKAEPKLSNQYKVIEKTLYVIEQTENKSLEPDQNGSHTTPMSPSLSSSPSSPLLSSHLANEESKSTHSKEENESESTLSEEENDGSEFIVSEEENDESEYTLSEAEDSVSEHDEAENTNQVECLNVENQRPGRDAMVHTEDKDCPPQKLNFRRGKVVNLESENNGPRRLRFRQARLLGENQNGKGNVGRRSFRRRREVADGDQKAESEKVVLRHQDVDGKKDAQGLFNNVIEETASKLVETRKSKVKALVGAFETVISLQES